MKHKRFLSVIVCLSLLLGLCGCETKPKQKTSIKIGVTMYNQYDVFLSQMMSVFNEYASEKSKETGITITIDIVNAAGSQTTQKNQVKNMINNNFDVICVNLVDRTDGSYIIDMAKDNDVPIVFFNREIVSEDLERWDKLYYIGAKAEESGIMQGELIYDYWVYDTNADKNKDGIMQYVMLEGEPGHQDAIVRTESCVGTLEANGVLLEKIDYAIANWDRDQGKSKMLSMLNLGEYPEIVICNNDMMAMGAIDAYEELSIPLEERAKIFGIDGVEEGIDALLNNTLTATVYNDKEGQAKALLELSYRLGMNLDVDDLDNLDGKYIWVPYFKVTDENVDSLK